jgi:hypothetical protein
MGGMGGAAMDDCVSGFTAEADQDVGPTDTLNAQGDAPLPNKVVSWIAVHNWRQEHYDWHNVRLFDQSCKGVDWSTVADRDVPQCASTQQLVQRGLSRAPIQQGAPGDGYAFMVMHRHMIRGIRQAYPTQQALFAGFTHVPTTKDDPENPIPGRDIVWKQNQLTAIDKLEHLDQHLDEFPTEDDLGLYIETSFRWTTSNPSQQFSDPTSGLHTSLHSQWSVQQSPVLLGNNDTAINNRVFWKLHGWIDDVWQKYRDLEGLPEDEATYTEALKTQCEEMMALGEAAQKGGT